MRSATKFRYGNGYGLVLRSYDTWEVDIQTAGGGIIPRVEVLGPRLPEASTDERPQWVFFEFSEHENGRAYCSPVASRLPGNRDDRRGFVYYEEVGNYRLSIGRDGVFEVVNRKDPGKPLQVRILEAEAEIRTDTPKTSIVHQANEGHITITAEQDVTVKCTNAKVEASGSVELEAGGNASVTASGTVEISGSMVNIN